MTGGADPGLLAGWLAGRSIARDMPLPVPDRGGWRVDTGSDEEPHRYVFAEDCAGLRQLADTIDDPRIPLKLCATPEAMRAMLPRRWATGALHQLMTDDARRPADTGLPTGYRADLDLHGAACTLRIAAPDGTLAASGHVALWKGFRVFDRIVTHEAHRRRGLGRAMMALLATAMPDEAAQSVLVATEAGAALYTTLGWSIRAPYTTATIKRP